MSTEAIASFTAALKSKVELSSETSSYAIKGQMPSLVARPASQTEVAEVLSAACDAGLAVAPWGGGLHMALGSAPSRYDIALDLLKLNRVVEYEPADLTLTVEAGIRLQELQSKLRQHGQRLNLDPAGAGDATIGGILAVNASGPSRLLYGTARDLVIGMKVATPEGAIVSSGGRVVKNVAGYDMAKLHIGALGTLGVIVQASFKLQPIPEELGIRRVHGELAALLSLFRALRVGGLSASAVVLSRRQDEAAWSLHCRLEGSRPAVERSQHDLQAYAAERSLSAEAVEEDSWQDALFAASVPYDSNNVVAKIVARPDMIVGVLQAAAEAGASLCVYPGAGVAWASWAAANLAATQLHELRRRCEAMPFGGALIIESAPVGFDGAPEVWGGTRPDFALMRELKQQYDPQAVLNPGRYLGGL